MTQHCFITLPSIPHERYFRNLLTMPFSERDQWNLPDAFEFFVQIMTYFYLSATKSARTELYLNFNDPKSWSKQENLSLQFFPSALWASSNDKFYLWIWRPSKFRLHWNVFCYVKHTVLSANIWYKTGSFTKFIRFCLFPFSWTVIGNKFLLF